MFQHVQLSIHFPTDTYCAKFMTRSSAQDHEPAKSSESRYHRQILHLEVTCKIWCKLQPPRMFNGNASHERSGSQFNYVPSTANRFPGKMTHDFRDKMIFACFEVWKQSSAAQHLSPPLSLENGFRSACSSKPTLIEGCKIASAQAHHCRFSKILLEKLMHQKAQTSTGKDTVANHLEVWMMFLRSWVIFDDLR